MDLVTYDKEGWWKVCKEAKPDLTRDEFEFRWAHFETVIAFIMQMRGQQV
jgi:hypothetical protein